MSVQPIAKTWRRLLFHLLLGTTGTFSAANALFARQFARPTTPVDLPDMVYDPHLQVMVDPGTNQPLYVRAAMIAQDKDDEKSKKAEDKKADDKKSDKAKTDAKAKQEKTAAKKAKPLPSVTAGCSNCPKCDDHCG